MKHKKLWMTAGVILVLVLAAFYLYMMYRPGLWYGDAFLYQQEDGSFRGSDHYVDYELRITLLENGSSVSFAVDDVVKKYEFINSKESATVLLGSKPFTSPIVQIYEDGAFVFESKVAKRGDGYYFWDEEYSDVVITTVSDDGVNKEDLFPNYGTLYNWSQKKEQDTRGSLKKLLLLLPFIFVEVLDIVFPNLFYHLRHGLSVDGGKPSDWYRGWQKTGRVILGIIIVVGAISVFFP